MFKTITIENKCRYGNNNVLSDNKIVYSLFIFVYPCQLKIEKYQKQCEIEKHK